jgi:hypothetical protein
MLVKTWEMVTHKNNLANPRSPCEELKGQFQASISTISFTRLYIASSGVNLDIPFLQRTLYSGYAFIHARS